MAPPRDRRSISSTNFSSFDDTEPVDMDIEDEEEAGNMPRKTATSSTSVTNATLRNAKRKAKSKSTATVSSDEGLEEIEIARDSPQTSSVQWRLHKVEFVWGNGELNLEERENAFAVVYGGKATNSTKIQVPKGKPPKTIPLEVEQPSEEVDDEEEEDEEEPENVDPMEELLVNVKNASPVQPQKSDLPRVRASLDMEEQEASSSRSKVSAVEGTLENGTKTSPDRKRKAPVAAKISLPRVSPILLPAGVDPKLKSSYTPFSQLPRIPKKKRKLEDDAPKEEAGSSSFDPLSAIKISLIAEKAPSNPAAHVIPSPVDAPTISLMDFQDPGASDSVQQLQANGSNQAGPEIVSPLATVNQVPASSFNQPTKNVNNCEKSSGFSAPEAQSAPNPGFANANFTSLPSSFSSADKFGMSSDDQNERSGNRSSFSNQPDASSQASSFGDRGRNASGGNGFANNNSNFSQQQDQASEKNANQGTAASSGFANAGFANSGFSSTKQSSSSGGGGGGGNFNNNQSGGFGNQFGNNRSGGFSNQRGHPQDRRGGRGGFSRPADGSNMTDREEGCASSLKPDGGFASNGFQNAPSSAADKPAQNETPSGQQQQSSGGFANAGFSSCAGGGGGGGSSSNSFGNNRNSAGGSSFSSFGNNQNSGGSFGSNQNSGGSSSNSFSNNQNSDANKDGAAAAKPGFANAGFANSGFGGGDGGGGFSNNNNAGGDQGGGGFGGGGGYGSGANFGRGRGGPRGGRGGRGGGGFNGDRRGGFNNNNDGRGRRDNNNFDNNNRNRSPARSESRGSWKNDNDGGSQANRNSPARSTTDAQAPVANGFANAGFSNNGFASQGGGGSSFGSQGGGSSFGNNQGSSFGNNQGGFSSGGGGSRDGNKNDGNGYRGRGRGRGRGGGGFSRDQSQPRRSERRSRSPERSRRSQSRGPSRTGTVADWARRKAPGSKEEAERKGLSWDVVDSGSAANSDGERKSSNRERSPSRRCINELDSTLPNHDPRSSNSSRRSPRRGRSRSQRRRRTRSNSRSDSVVEIQNGNKKPSVRSSSAKPKEEKKRKSRSKSKSSSSSRSSRSRSSSKKVSGKKKRREEKREQRRQQAGNQERLILDVAKLGKETKEELGKLKEQMVKSDLQIEAKFYEEITKLNIHMEAIRKHFGI